MKTVSVTWHTGSGWSAPLPAELDSPDTMVLVFGPTELLDDATPFEQIRAVFVQSVVAGASSATVIENGRLSDAALVVAVTRFDHTRLRVVSECGDAIDGPGQRPEEAHACGGRLARRLRGDMAPAAVLAFADGLLVNGPEFVRGMVDRLPVGVPLAGGMAADGTRYGRTWVVADGRLRRAATTAIGFYGDCLEVHTACGGGSVGFGPRRRVTRSAGNVVFELDSKPALRVYEQYLGDRAAALPGSASHFPLTVHRESNHDMPMIRHVLGIDRVNQSITLAGDVPHGSVVQLSRAGRGELLRAADLVAVALIDWCDAPCPALNLSVSCSGRQVVLGEQAGEEAEMVFDGLLAGASQIGFYAYGEVSGGGDAVAEMHSMTLAVTTLRERAPCRP